MGYSPREIDKMTLWELSACTEGWIKANGAEQEADAPTWDEHLAMVSAVRG